MRNARIDVSKLTCTTLIENVDLRRQLERQASYERSEAVHELLVAPVTTLFRRIPAEASETLIRRFIAVCLALGAFVAAFAEYERGAGGRRRA